jgi:hypothetical protein
MLITRIIETFLSKPELGSPPISSQSHLEYGITTRTSSARSQTREILDQILMTQLYCNVNLPLSSRMSRSVRTILVIFPNN